MTGTLDIRKASAGSGKTHTLARKYIKILLDGGADTESYKHILAVTFTNKATEEMKNRIVSLLYNLSQGKGEDLEGLDKADAAKVSARAKTILTAILHDYSNFQVTTIDKFFQQIYRSFARELGSFSNYRVELSDEDVLQHAIDDMLSDLDDTTSPNAKVVYDVINSFALDQWRYNGKSRYADRLNDFGKLFLKEDFKIKSKNYSHTFAAIDKAGADAAKMISDFESSVRDYADQVREAVAEQGIVAADFKGGKSGAFQKILSYRQGTAPSMTEPQKQLLTEAPIKWFPKNGEPTRLIALANAACNRGDKPGLDTLLKGIVEEYNTLYAKYRTAIMVRNNLGVMKLFGGIYDALSRYLKENNLMLLTETTQALHSMIDSSDTPFIYERIGSWLDHYLLDEFQDFSMLQWENFMPLLAQSLDSGGDNLIVGDVKQSIYRWRGSDWSILDNKIDSDLSGKNLHHEGLNTNYRTDYEIVTFNNDFFSDITDPSSGYFQGEKTIASVYSDCRQLSKSQSGGHVKVVFYEGKDENDDLQSLSMLKPEIDRFSALGYPKSAICILVRTNKEAAEAAARLIADGFEVITEESLLVGGSSYVRRIIAVLKYIVDSRDKVNAQVISEIGLDVENVDLEGNSLYDVCENIIRSMDDSMIEGQLPYLLTFMDSVLDYMRDKGSDIAGFVKWWDETGCNQAISAPRGADAVRIMTIHKAKGLDSPAVIVPFFREALSAGRNNYMWCDDKTAFQAGLMPVEFNKDVAESTLSDEYFQESLLYKMDALNTAYVAFTRAKHELVVFAKKKKTASAKEPKSIAEMLQLWCAAATQDGVYERGRPTAYRASKDPGESVTRRQLDGYKSIPMEGTGAKKRLSLVLRGSDFFDPAGRDAARERGIVLHDILSRITTAADIPASVDVAVNSGEIPETERDAAGAHIRQMLSSVESYGWFRDGVEVINELSIIDTDGKVYRPDRVMVSENDVTVVDYKFGQPHAGYPAQVRRYMEMLRRMGYGNVTGYLWYAAENKIEKVA